MRKPLTGEPYAGIGVGRAFAKQKLAKPHVRFGGRGVESLLYPYSGFAKNSFVSVRCAVYFIDWTPAFAGVLGSSQASQAGTVRKMADAIFHRGPDGGGVWCDSEQRIGFGHLNGNEAPSS